MIARKMPRVISKPTRRQIARLASASLMSSTKWRKLFTALDPLRAEASLHQVIMKFLDTEGEHVMAMPTRHDLLVPWAYVELKFGPTAWSEIEWIEIPVHGECERISPNGTGRIPSARFRQDIAKAEAAIARLGKYPLGRTTRGLRITGHIRRSDAT